MVELPWGIYEYQRVSMELCISPDIFQEKMSELMTGLEFCRLYIKDLSIISRRNFVQYLEHLKQALTQLSEAGLKINATKNAFCRAELEYLRYWITHKRIRNWLRR